MVLAERNTGDLVRNGRRSRGPSPNTHTGGGGAGGPGSGLAVNVGSSLGNGNNAGGGTGGAGGGGGGSLGGGHGAHEKAANATTNAPGAGTPESSDDDNSTKRNGKTKTKQSEYEEKIRVGRDYQAVCPPLIPEVERRPETMNERALLVWSPTKEIPDMKLEEYIAVAKEKYGYNGEQALGMLFWHKHDLERAVMDLANFTPFPDEWTIEDKVLFEQAFQFHGKSFHRIRQMLPDKSIASLVKYYYSWKKTRHRSSAMDRQEKTPKATVKDGSENGSEVGSNEESDNDDKKANNNNSTTNNNNASTQTPNNNNTNAVAGSNGNGNGNGDSNGSSSSNSNNNARADPKLEQLCIYTNANNEDILGFDLSGIADAVAANGGSAGQPGIGSAATAGGGGGGGINDDSRRVVVGGFCKNCNVVCYILYDSPLGRMCQSCHTHWRRTGNRRPISGPECIVAKRSTTQNNAASGAGVDRSKRKPPKGMYINHDDLTALASCKNPCEYLAEGERKIAALMAEIQKNRQLMEHLDKECDAIVVEDVIKPTTPETAAAQPRISARWTPDEIQVATMALRDHGKNYAMIAKVVTTKTESHVRTFYLNNRRRLNLDQIVKEYEAMVASKAEEQSIAEEQAESVAVAAVAMATAEAVVAAVVTAEAVATATLAESVSGITSSELAESQSSPNGSKNHSPERSNQTEDAVVIAAAKKKPETLSTANKGSESTTGETAATLTSTTGTASKSSSIRSSTDDSGLKQGQGLAEAVIVETAAANTTATITIVDESDTTTNSSSELVTTAAANSQAALVVAPSNAGPTAILVNSLAGKASPRSQSERDSEDSSSVKSASNSGATKRDSSVLQPDQLPSAKKIALSPAAAGDFLGTVAK